MSSSFTSIPIYITIICIIIAGIQYYNSAQANASKRASFFIRVGRCGHLRRSMRTSASVDAYHDSDTKNPSTRNVYNLKHYLLGD